MQKTLFALSLAAGIGLVCCQTAGAAPASGTAVKQAASAVSDVTQAQYAERRTRRGVVKCFRDFVVGPYRCHFYPSPF